MRFLQGHSRYYGQSTGIEFIVIDNASTDNTPRVLRQWLKRMRENLFIIRNDKNRGFGPANNQGAEKARGDILIFISNDVVLQGDYVMPIEDKLAANPDALVGAQLFKYDTGWNAFGGEIYPYLAGWCLACTAETWLDLSGFDERYVPCDYEDIDLSMTAVKKGIELLQVTVPLQHAFGQSAQALPGGRERVTHRNRELFIKKWDLQ